jgi:CheY-like chemotaxis protein
MTPLKVLYVDDEPFIREVATIALELDPGFEVRAVDSGIAALSLLEAADWRPDVILLDVMMPELDGPATLARLRDDERYASTPVIFLTAKAQARDHEPLAKLDVRGIITKPFEPISLAGDVRRLLQG